MKKVLTLAVLVGLMVFSVTTSAFATTLYFDSMVGGTEKTASAKNDLIWGLLGVEIPVDERNKLNFEYHSFAVDGDNSGFDAKMTGFLSRFSHELIQGDAFQLYDSLSFISMRGNSVTSDMEYSPFMLGVEAQYHINERMFLNGIFDCAVLNKDYDMNGKDDTDADYMAARLNFNYLFTERYGVSVGYRWSELKIKNNAKNTDTGYALGLMFKF